MPSAEQVRATVERYVEAFQKGDREGWLACFADDAVQFDPVTEPPNVGRDAIAAFWDQTHQLADGFGIDVHWIHACGDEAVLAFTVQVNGAGIEFDIADVMQIGDDGRITQLRAYFDLSQARPIG
jgi:steroid Delta-isomerase